MAMAIIINHQQKTVNSGRFNFFVAILDCGHTFSRTRWAESKEQAGTIGEMVDCQTCTDERTDEQWLRDLDYSTVHHSRFKEWCGIGQYHFYRVDHTSPSHFMLIGSVKATPAIDAILKTKTNCGPLSPTERA